MKGKRGGTHLKRGVTEAGTFADNVRPAEGSQGDQFGCNQGQVKEEVTFAFLPAFPGSGRTLPCSRWLAHLRGGCKVAPYTVWTSPRVWPQMPRHHWQWWTCPVNRKDVVSLVCPQCMFSKGYFSLLSLNTRIHTWENALHKDSRAGDLLWAMHKGTKAQHCCFAGRKHHVFVDPRHLIRCSFHWVKPLETGQVSEKVSNLPSLLRKSAFASSSSTML